MTKLAFLLFAALFVASLIHTPQVLAQDTGGGEPFAVEPHRVVIQVNGIVCSFCAYGAEKSLAELDELDTSAFGNGVLIDIHTHRITLAMEPAAAIPFQEIYERIKKAGYDPIEVRFHLSGTLEGSGDTLRLRDMASDQAFAVLGSNAGALRTGDHVEVQARVDAMTIPELSEGELIGIWIDEPPAKSDPSHD